MNPFKYGETVDGEHFCRRPELARILKGYVKSGPKCCFPIPTFKHSYTKGSFCLSVGYFLMVLVADFCASTEATTTEVLGAFPV